MLKFAGDVFQSFVTVIKSSNVGLKRAANNSELPNHSLRVDGVKTLRTQDTSDPRHFGTIRLVPNCLDLNNTFLLQYVLMVYSQNGDKPKRRQPSPRKVFQAQAWTCDRTSSPGLPRTFAVICGDLR